MQIRRATAADAQSIAEVHVRGWQIGYAGFINAEYLSTLSVRQETMRWLAGLADPLQADVFVAEDGGRVIGWTGFGTNRSDLGLDVGEIYAIEVDPQAWGRGAGLALLNAAEAGLADAGFATAVLWALTGDVFAREFYQSRGWQEDGYNDVHQSLAPVMRYRRQLAARVDPNVTSA